MDSVQQRGNGQSNFSTGLATLRRDGFVSVHADEEGFLTTGNITFVNADVKGTLKVELSGTDDIPIRGSTKNDCMVISADGTKHLIKIKLLT